MKIGYARVSTYEQNLDIQITELKKAGCEKIFKEKITGTHPNRPELNKMLEQLRPKDVVIVWKLDRLARSTKGLLEICDKITQADASFKSISEVWADTTTPGGKMIITIFAGIAEFERDLIVERTTAGRKLAKERGIRFGRPVKLETEQIKAAKKMIAEGSSIKQTAHIFKVHPATIYRSIGNL